MKLTFIFTILFIVVTACGKNKEVKIIAKNAATGAPYAGLEYLVVSSRTAANGEKYKTEASGTLNSNGEAMVSIKKKSGRSYSIQVKAPENSCYTNQSPQFFDSPYDVNGTFNFEFAECAYLKQEIINLNCQGANDIFNIMDRYTYTEWSSWSVDILGCYPNPTTGKLYVPNKLGSFEIYNSLGIKIVVPSTDLNRDEVLLDFKEFAKGIYYIHYVETSQTIKVSVL